MIWIPFNDMFPIGNILSVYPFEYVFSGGSCPLNSHSIIYNIPLPFIYAGESSNHPSMCLLIPMFSFIVPSPKVNQILCAYQILFLFRSFYLFFAYSWSSNYHFYWLNVYHFLCKCLPTLIPLYNPLWVVIWIPFNDMFPIGNILSVYPFEYVFSGGSCPLNSHSIIYNIP